MVLILRDGDFVQVTTIDVSQPRNRTSLEAVEIDSTGECILVPSNSLVPPFSDVGDEVEVSIYYPRPENNYSGVGSMEITETTWGDIKTRGTVKTLPAYDDTRGNEGWYQVVESSKDGTCHVVAVKNITPCK